MTDRELLELAAKAAGYDFAWYCRGANNPNGIPNAPFANGHEWNPLTDDGDALRLAVKLGMLVSVTSYIPGENAWGFTSAVYKRAQITEKFTDKPYAATCRAIVRVAAEIGKGLK